VLIFFRKSYFRYPPAGSSTEAQSQTTDVEAAKLEEEHVHKVCWFIVEW